ncbi:4960_t:CDS:1, partial [Dentiscutata heterogama]
MKAEIDPKTVPSTEPELVEEAVNVTNNSLSSIIPIYSTVASLIN